MNLQAWLTKEIHRQHQNIRKPEGYADVILEGIELEALDINSAKRRKEFLKSKRIKEHVFVQSYTKFNFLTAIKDAEQMPVIASSSGLLFDYTNAQSLLASEQASLFKHINSDVRVKIIVIKSLNLLPSATVSMIKNKMIHGDLFQQASIYEKVFRDLGKNGITPQGYGFLGVRTTPISHYYLSISSNNIIARYNIGE